MNSTLIPLILAIQSAFQGLIGPADLNGACPPSNTTQFNVSDWRVNIGLSEYADKGQDSSQGCSMGIAFDLSGCMEQAEMQNALGPNSRFNTSGHLDFKLSFANDDATPSTSANAEIDWFGGMGGTTENTSRLCGDLRVNLNTTLKPDDWIQAWHQEMPLSPEAIEMMSRGFIQQGNSIPGTHTWGDKNSNSEEMDFNQADIAALLQQLSLNSQAMKANSGDMSAGSTEENSGSRRRNLLQANGDSNSSGAQSGTDSRHVSEHEFQIGNEKIFTIRHTTDQPSSSAPVTSSIALIPFIIPFVASL